MGLLLLVAMILGALLYVGRLRERAGSGHATPAVPSRELRAHSERVDPFAPAGAEEEERQSASAGDSDDPFASLGPLPKPGGPRPTRTPEPGELVESKVWLEAIELSEIARWRVTLSVGDREQGDPVAEAAHQKEALEHYRRALLISEGWVEREISRFDPSDAQVRTVLARRKVWQKKVSELARSAAE